MSDISYLINKLWPVYRSLTGNGNRKTLNIIKEYLPELQITEVPSGERIFDWIVPDEWNIKDAYIITPSGEKIADFKKNNLHVVGYSSPLNKEVSLDELKKHLFTLPETPNAIPYKTSYYNKSWGFCITHNEYSKLKEGIYKVVIESEFKQGALSYGEYIKKGTSKKEFIFSTYICHPSLANDNLSGIILNTLLAKKISTIKTRYSYRFLFTPETLGTLCWLNNNKIHLKNVTGGYVITCVGDNGSFRYKKSKQGNNFIDNIAIKTLQQKSTNFIIEDYFPFGSDERQFNSPGFNLNFGSLMRTRYNMYKEYHTSKDNLEFISESNINESLSIYFELIRNIEHETLYENKMPFGEPQLGKRKLYFQKNIYSDSNTIHNALIWILSYGDGNLSLEDISEISQLPLSSIHKAAEMLKKNNLIEKY